MFSLSAMCIVRDMIHCTVMPEVIAHILPFSDVSGHLDG